MSLVSNLLLYLFYLSIFISHFQNTTLEEGVMKFLKQFLETNHRGMKSVISSGKCACKSGSHTPALGLSEMCFGAREIFLVSSGDCSH